MDWNVVTLRVYITLVLMVFGFDTCADAIGAPYVQTSTVSVSKIPWLFEDGLGWVPSGTDISNAHGYAAFFAWYAALVQFGMWGVAHRRIATAAAAGCYTFAYMATSLNSYQHKYFLAMLIWMLALPERDVRKYVRASVAILYWWTAVAKVVDGGTFLSGTYLPYLMATSSLDSHIASVVPSSPFVWNIAPYAVVAAELLLCVLFATRRRPGIAALVVICVHGSVELAGSLNIGLFSYYMLMQCLVLVQF